MGVRNPSRNRPRPSASRPSPEMPDWARAVGQRAARTRNDTIVRAIRHLGLSPGIGRGRLLLWKRMVKPASPDRKAFAPYRGESFAPRTRADGPVRTRGTGCARHAVLW